MLEYCWGAAQLIIGIFFVYKTLRFFPRPGDAILACVTALAIIGRFHPHLQQIPSEHAIGDVLPWRAPSLVAAGYPYFTLAITGWTAASTRMTPLTTVAKELALYIFLSTTWMTMFQKPSELSMLSWQHQMTFCFLTLLFGAAYSGMMDLVDWLASQVDDWLHPLPWNQKVIGPCGEKNKVAEGPQCVPRV